MNVPSILNGAPDRDYPPEREHKRMMFDENYRWLNAACQAMFMAFLAPTGET
jgi:hypothetical protein